jgi:hypothetical protein
MAWIRFIGVLRVNWVFVKFAVMISPFLKNDPRVPLKGVIIKMIEQSFVPSPQREIFEYQATFKNHIRFEIPYNLEDPSIVKEWYIKYGVLHITLIIIP